MRKHAIKFDPKEDRTEQSHKTACNVNYILRKYQKSGVVDHIKQHGPEYADVPAHDFREAMEVVTKASSMFEELPSRARAKFKNDPAQFLEYVQNPDNIESLHDLGLTDPFYEPPNTTKEEEKGEEKKGSTATSNSEGDSDANASE